MRVSYGLLTGLMALCMVLAGCEGGVAPEKLPANAGERMPVVREFTGQQVYFPDFGVFVVQRPEVWQALWGKNPVPDVDFSQHSVVVALMGQQSTTGHNIHITSVCAGKQSVAVYVTQTYPGPKSTCTKVMTYPYDMVVVPKITLPVQTIVSGMPIGPLPILDMYMGQQSNAVEAQTVVIRDAVAWQKFSNDLFATGAMASPVDFGQNMVVAVLLGRKPVGGYSVMITSATLINDRLTVNYRMTCPQPGDVVIQTITSPYAIAVVPVSSLPVAFRDITNLPSLSAPVAVR